MNLKPSIETALNSAHADWVRQSLTYLRGKCAGGEMHFHLTRLETALVEKPDTKPGEDED